MGVRGEIYSTKVALDKRTYFFNVKENRLGDLYLNIVESKNKETGGFDRQSIILFAEDLQLFLKGFDEALKVMEKAHKQGLKQANSQRASATAPGAGTGRRTVYKARVNRRDGQPTSQTKRLKTDQAKDRPKPKRRQQDSSGQAGRKTQVRSVKPQAWWDDED